MEVMDVYKLKHISGHSKQLEQYMVPGRVCAQGCGQILSIGGERGRGRRKFLKTTPNSTYSVAMEACFYLVGESGTCVRT